MSIASHYTVAQLTRIMHRSRPSVHSLILSGRLAAYDANPDGDNRQWRVTPEALEAFIRGAQATSTAIRRRKKTPAGTVKKFF